MLFKELSWGKGKGKGRRLYDVSSAVALIGYGMCMAYAGRHGQRARRPKSAIHTSIRAACHAHAVVTTSFLLTRRARCFRSWGWGEGEGQAEIEEKSGAKARYR